MRVLFLVMEFIPLNLAGVYRPLRFANGLKRAGIDVTIVSIKPDEQLKKIQTRFDFTLEEKLEPGIEWVKVPMDDITGYYSNRFRRFFGTYFNISDNYASAWQTNLNKVLPDIIANHKPDLILTTCPPFSSAQLTRSIALKYKLPYVLDMRDAWSQLSMQPLGSYLHYLVKKRAEYKCFRDAVSVICVTPQLRKMACKSHPGIDPGKFEVIFNAYDDSLQLNLARDISAPSILEKKEINIGYIGTYYYNPEARERMLKPWWKRRGHRMLNYTPVREDWLYRSPFFFLKTMKDFLNRNPELESKLYFNHVGEVPTWLQEMVEKEGLSKNVRFLGFLPHKEAIRVQSNFDYLLATSEKVVGDDHYCLPSKLFTYIASGKPVIGFVTEGIQKTFIKNSGMGIVINPDDSCTQTEFERILISGFRSTYNSEYLQTFSSTSTNERFVNLLTKIKNEQK